MPFEIKYQNNGFIAKLSGLISHQDFISVNNYILGSPDFDNHNYQIMDLLEADLSELDASHPQYDAAVDYSSTFYKSNVKVATVVTEPYAVELTKNYIEMNKKLGSPWNFMIFNTFAEAEKWVKS